MRKTRSEENKTKMVRPLCPLYKKRINETHI